MDVVTLALARQYADSQRLAYAEEKEYVFGRGLHENEIVTFFGYPYYKVSNEAVDFNTVTSWTASHMINGNILEETLSKDELMLVSENTETGAVFFLCKTNSEIIIAISSSVDIPDETGNLLAGGTYLLCGEAEKELVDSAQLTVETIHPIDPKYLPALDSITLNGADGKQYKLAVDESGALAATAIE